LGGKRLELIKEVDPKISRVGVLWAADDQGSAIGFKDYETAAHALKIPLQSLGVRGPKPDLESAFGEATKGPSSALIAIRGRPAQSVSKTDCGSRHREPAAFNLRRK
jgi:putative ABC transport system substrate-binding protein